MRQNVIESGAQLPKVAQPPVIFATTARLLWIMVISAAEPVIAEVAINTPQIVLLTVAVGSPSARKAR